METLMHTCCAPCSVSCIQQLRSEGAIHRRAGTAGSQPHRPALGQTGSQQALALCLGQIFSQRQFPRRNGRTKGGKLCFHILAA